MNVLAAPDDVFVGAPGTIVADVAAGESSKFELPCASAQEIVRRLMWLSASVKAPAIIVEVVELTWEALVEARSSRRFRVTCSSTTRKGRYLFA